MTGLCWEHRSCHHTDLAIRSASVFLPHLGAPGQRSQHGVDKALCEAAVLRGALVICTREAEE